MDRPSGRRLRLRDHAASGREVLNAGDEVWECVRRNRQIIDWSSLTRNAPGRDAAQDFERAQRGRRSGFNCQRLHDLQHVLFHGRFADAENAGDLGVGLALRDPQQDFGDTRRQRQRGCQRKRGRKIRLELGPGLLGALRCERQAAGRTGVGSEFRQRRRCSRPPKRDVRGFSVELHLFTDPILPGHVPQWRENRDSDWPNRYWPAPGFCSPPKSPAATTTSFFGSM